MNEKVPPDVSEIECINVASWSAPNPKACTGTSIPCGTNNRWFDPLRSPPELESQLPLAVYVSCPSDNRIILVTGFFSRRSFMTLLPFLSPSAIFVPPFAINELTAWTACCFPASVILRSGNRRRAADENTITANRSAGPRFCITKPMARLSNAIFVPAILPLISRTVTRSTGARAEVETGAFRWIKTVKSSAVLRLGTAATSLYVFNNSLVEYDPSNVLSFLVEVCTSNASSSLKTAGSLAETWRLEVCRGRGRRITVMGGAKPCCGISFHLALQIGHVRFPCLTCETMHWKWNECAHSDVKMASPSPRFIDAKHIVHFWKVKIGIKSTELVYILSESYKKNFI
ncbi:hypothetical protein HanRHA438_Chr09g0391391 [Helianthus annuus]|nr:hypothetical protein HanIR_Chr09g0409291 [Helianthus annuus]KAJ0541795.1 hypothetical protein HanHA89_Chr09g0332541 [Helianthus annuus]KAJ0887492.1 hypothetical protein HanRHA438_Chr09g0391391 [Helianthus annuus]